MSDIHFGTDGWRAIIGKDFTEENLVRVCDAAAQVFLKKLSCSDALSTGVSGAATSACANTIIVGYDCRQDASKYAALAAEVLAGWGLKVKLSDAFCPTPTLCWSVKEDAAAIGGVMLTSSHNPAEYLGVKLRMEDGGASPKTFTDEVEAALSEQASSKRGSYELVDLMTPYLEDLKSLVDTDAIRSARLRVVYDPMFGAGRGYLTKAFQELGVQVDEIHGETDPTFQGLHPEPIMPWIDQACQTVACGSYDAGFITDGDADRIGAIDGKGNFVNPHQILTMLIAHLAQDKKMSGRVIRTISGSSLLERQCKRLGLELVTTPVGFKWIYEEMEKGGVLIGGEESGGIGIPGHVFERDGLLMALLLCELMAQKKKSLGELVAEMFACLGKLEYKRRDLRVTQEQKERFLAHKDGADYEHGEVAGLSVKNIDRRDGVKYCLQDDAWLLMRPSGTEPLVRVYAEAANSKQLEEILDAGCKMITG